MVGIMESPIVVALFVFFGIILLFFVISLFSDLLIFAIILGSSILAYLVPEIYQAENFQQVLHENLSFLDIFGVTFPAELDIGTHYLLAFLIMLGGTLLCVPVLPFSALFRQMLGANKISGRDEILVKRIIAEELELIRQRVSAEKKRRQQSALKRHMHSYDNEDEEDLDLVNERPGRFAALRERFHALYERIPWRRRREAWEDEE